MSNQQMSMTCRVSIVCMMVGFGTAMHCNSVMAQAVAKVQVIPFGGNAANDTDLNERQLQAVMELRIDEMRDVCELSDVQVKKLGIVAKVAVKNAIKLRKERENAVERQFKKLNVPNILGGPRNRKDQDDETFSDEDEEKSEQRDQEEEKKGKPLAAIKGSSEPYAQEVWKEAVAQILTEAQQEKLAAADKSRREFRRQYRVLAKVDQLDFVLRLTDSQRAALTKVIDKTIGKSFEAPSVKTSKIAKLKIEDLTGILSQKQLSMYQDQKFDAMAGLLANANQPKPRLRIQAFRAVGGRPYFGASTINSDAGVELRRVTPGSPADSAGLKAGDIITSIDGKFVDTAIQFRREIGMLRPGNEIRVKYLRNGEAREVTVSLGDK